MKYYALYLQSNLIRSPKKGILEILSDLWCILIHILSWEDCVKLSTCKISYIDIFSSSNLQNNDNHQGLSWSWSHGSWIYNYLCNQCLSPLKLWVRIPLRRCVLDTTLCDKVCQWLATGLWFSVGTPVSSTNKTDHHDITGLLLKEVLNTITLIP